ncbi:hypothetical protein WMY93_020102 [Mugilogobius chulae]|uniref:Uncharacterized protein n=1 Tax=Mugilogobius chulae TaxID=88201 RepID=A0AAW0NKD9_9GOBI
MLSPDSEAHLVPPPRVISLQLQGKFVLCIDPSFNASGASPQSSDRRSAALGDPSPEVEVSESSILSVIMASRVHTCLCSAFLPLINFCTLLQQTARPNKTH